jgi:hypothetical protein
VAQQQGRNIEEEKYLRATISEPEFKEAYARLITIRNLPHSMLDWPEFWAVILSVNNMVKETSRQGVPKFIESTYLLHRTHLIKKLKKSLSWLHFPVNMWTSPAKIGFQAIVVHWADADFYKVETALLSLSLSLSLSEFKRSHGGEEQARTFIKVILECSSN